MDDGCIGCLVDDDDNFLVFIIKILINFYIFALRSDMEKVNLMEINIAKIFWKLVNGLIAMVWKKIFNEILCFRRKNSITVIISVISEFSSFIYFLSSFSGN